MHPLLSIFRLGAEIISLYCFLTLVVLFYTYNKFDKDINVFVNAPNLNHPQDANLYEVVFILSFFLINSLLDFKPLHNSTFAYMWCS